jgi:hypothetical protein
VAGGDGQQRQLEQFVQAEVTKKVINALDQRWTAAAGVGSKHGQQARQLAGATLSDGSVAKPAAEKWDARRAAVEVEAWAAYDEIGEIGTLVDGTANLLSQCRFYVGKRIKDGDKFIDVPAELLPDVSAEDAQLANEVLARYTDESGSQAGLIRSIAQNWSVCGAAKMVGYVLDGDGKPLETAPGVPIPVDATEVWQAVAPTSLRLDAKTKNTWNLNVTEGEVLKLTKPVVYDLRWSHPRFPQQSIGWVMTALDICRDLRAFTGGQRSAARSGIPADLLLVPLESNPKKPQQLGLNDDGTVEQTDPQVTANQYAGLIEDMVGGFIMEVMHDLESGISAVPGVLAVGQDFIEKFKTLSFARVVDRTLIELVNQARLRLAEVADCPPETLKGFGTTNRWNGGQIADDEYRRYFRPKANGIADQLTAHPFRHGLMAVRRTDLMDRLGLRVLVDPSDAVASPDYSKLVLGLLDRFVIGPKGALEVLGLNPSLAPSPAEVAQMIEWKSAGKPQPSDNTGRGDQGPPDEAKPVDGDKGSVVHIGQVHLTPLHQLAAAGEPTLSDRLFTVEMQTRARLEEACEAALDRAIDRANAKLKNWARKAGVTPPLGFSLAKQLADDNPTTKEEMWAAALTALSVAFRRIANDAYVAAQLAIGSSLPKAEITAAIARAEGVLIDGMMELADRNVFQPPMIVDEGEATTLRIPTPLLRRVMAVAGGALGVGAGLDPDAEAAFGLAFGPLLARLTPEVADLEWVYGPGVRSKHFQPHRELDGGRFTGPTDPGLSGSVFAAFPYWYPGDHQGCQCSWKPVYASDDELPSAPDQGDV